MKKLDRPHNLPSQLTSFVGRDEEIAGINKLFQTNRSITLIGTGGVGKTRLCLEFATAELEDYKDGVWFIELGSLLESQLIIDQIYSAIGLQVTAKGPSIDDLCEYLQYKDTILILDNCEHLVLACAKIAEHLLLYCPKLRLISTSREPLGFPGETLFHVPVMKLPPVDGQLDWEKIGGSEAVRLLLERIRTFQPDIQIDEANAPAITQICHQLEGIPLALELAAARVRLLSLPQIAARLENCLQLLTKGDRVLQPRQQTLRATIDWSYTLLSEQEQILFRRLSIFSGRFTVEDVERVCLGRIAPTVEDTPDKSFERDNSIGEIKRSEVIDLFSNVVDKSLVEVVLDEEAIYRMLIPVHQFAREKLHESGEEEFLHQRHFTHYLEVAEDAKIKLRSAEQSVWFKKLEIEHDNLRAALAWSLESGSIERGLLLATALKDSWFRQGYLREGVEWFERLLKADQTTSLTYARALVVAGELDYHFGNFDRADSYAELSLQMCEDYADQKGIACAQCLSGIVAHFEGDRLKGIRHLEKSLELFRAIGDEWYVARTLLYLGDAYIRTDNFDQAAILTKECLAIFREFGDDWGIGFALGCAGELARKTGDHRKAMDYFREALTMHCDPQHKVDICYLLEVIAITEIEQGNFEKAAVLWGAADSLRKIIHAPLPSSYQVDYAPFLVEARFNLGESAYENELEMGTSMSFEQSIDIALQDQFTSPKKADELISDDLDASIQLKFGLTAREVEVLRLVAEGCTDAKVAEQLFISPRTVGKHLQSIYRKLQVGSRTAAARFAIDEEII